jgi:hypothetical protein
MGSHIKGVKVGICCELGIGNRTNGSGSKAGKSSEGKSAKLRGGIGLNRLDGRPEDNNGGKGGSKGDSTDEVDISEGVEGYCKLDVPWGHQQ